MFSHEFFGLMSGMVSLLAYIPLVMAWRNGWKPQRTTWSIWMFVSAIIGTSMYMQGVRSQAIITIGYCIGSSTIAILSWKRGVGGWTAFDKICIGFAVAGVGAYIITKDPMQMLMANIVADFSAALPTIKKLIKEPGSENFSGWVTFFAGAIIGLFGVSDWSMTVDGIAQWAYVCYLATVIGFITILTLRRPKLAIA